MVSDGTNSRLPAARTKDEIEAAALKLEPVCALWMGGRVKKVIVVPQRIVNVVA